jgi:hypothetical protein
MSKITLHLCESAEADNECSVSQLHVGLAVGKWRCGSLQGSCGAAVHAAHVAFKAHHPLQLLYLLQLAAQAAGCGSKLAGTLLLL